LFVWLLAASWPVRAHEQGPVLQLRHDLDHYEAGCHVQYLADSRDEWSVEHVAGSLPASRWRPGDGRTLKLDAERPVYWLRLTIAGPVEQTPVSAQDTPWLFDPGGVFHEDVAVFLATPSDEGEAAITPLYASGNRSELLRNVGGSRYGSMILLPRLDDRPYTLYWRMESRGGSLLHPVICSLEHYQTQSVRRMLWLGLLLGVLAALLLYNLFLFFSLRDRTYLWYSAYLFFLALHFFGSSRLSMEYLPHVSAAVRMRGALLALGAAMAMAGCFARAFVKTADRLPRLDVLLRFFIGAAILVTAVSLCAEIPLAGRVLTLLGLCAAILLISTGLLAWHSGVRQARYYLPAVLASGSSGIFGALVFPRLLPCNEVNFYGFKAGIVLEALLLALALADRIHILQRDREALQQSERRHMALAFTDALTGLFNVRFFRTHIDVEMQRAQQLGQPLTLMMFDVDNFKRFNDLYGHLAGDRVLRVLGRIISDSVRDRDVACRYGGEEFAVILVGSSYLAALEIHRRINAALRQKLAEGPDGLPAPVTLSIGVSEYIPGEEIDDFIQRADTALYAAKERGRDRLVVAGPPETDRLQVGYDCFL
jgi:diguanylate cyclase (GGDEF)-like protein